jgi:hypothetical protein
MSIDRGQLQALIRDLGAIPPDLKRELRPGLRKAAQPALTRIRSNASWSSRIPGATKISTSFGNTPGVTIRVDSKAAPGARPIEHGGEPGKFRHPRWGDREHWYDQPARPFFYRGVEATADQIRDAVGDLVDGVARRHGF